MPAPPKKMELAFREHNTGAEGHAVQHEAPQAQGAAVADACTPELLARAAELAATEAGAGSRLLSLRDEWIAASEELTRGEAAHASWRDQVAELEQELAFMNKELELRQQELEQRSTSMSDASVLAHLQRAITTLQEELRDLNVYIGLTSCLLLDATTAPPA